MPKKKPSKSPMTAEDAKDWAESNGCVCKLLDRINWAQPSYYLSKPNTPFYFYLSGPFNINLPFWLLQQMCENLDIVKPDCVLEYENAKEGEDQD